MFGLGWSEILVAGIVGLLLFGGELPKVAAEAARWVVGLKRSLNDIRRETGIEREIENAKREVEASVEHSLKVREVQQKLTDTIARPFREAAQDARSALDSHPVSPAAPASVVPPPLDSSTAPTSAPPPPSATPVPPLPPVKPLAPLPPPPRPTGAPDSFGLRDEAAG